MLYLYTGVPGAGFNTQPPKGGWNVVDTIQKLAFGFNTQPPKGGWVKNGLPFNPYKEFQHTAA
mgnify:CR=1 FL=1